MPASMISAPTGSMPKVIGNSIAIVAIGPTPGSTPISVPMRQPRKHSARFLNERATARPSPKLAKSSPMSVAQVPWRERDRQTQQELEQHRAERCEDNRKQHDFPQANTLVCAGRDEDRQRPSHDKAPVTDRHCENDGGPKHEQRTAQGPALEALAFG